MFPALTISKGLLRDAPIIDTVLAIPAPTESQDVVADYGSGLTLERHPLALLRSQLAAMRLKSAKQIGQLNRMAAMYAPRASSPAGSVRGSRPA